MKRCLILVFVLCLLVGCAGSEPTPTPDLIATQIAVEEAAHATMTAQAPTTTYTPKPPDTATPTSTPVSTAAPSPTPGSPGADRVVTYAPGLGAKKQYTNPENLLGAPDLVEDPCCEGMVQLGREGIATLAFTDNVVLDGYGPDFKVFGESAKDDFLLIEVSNDGITWYAFPKVNESPGGLDLADVGLRWATLVRLTDVQPGTETGAEVDAVVALNSGPVIDYSMVDSTPTPTSAWAAMITAAAPTPTSTPSVQISYVTMDGYDKEAGVLVPDINVWKDYNDRSAGVAVVVKHGDRVKLIRRQGDAVLIEAGGKRGWVTYYFIKEFK